MEEHRAPASMIGLGNRAEHRGQRTGAPCSEVAGVVSGNWSGDDGFMVQATRGTAVELGASGNRSDGIGFDTRATCAVTIARARGQPRTRGIVRGSRVQNAWSGDDRPGCAFGYGSEAISWLRGPCEGPVSSRETGGEASFVDSGDRNAKAFMAEETPR
jgi:hypothetical protein